VERIQLTIVDNTERVLVDIEWVGGHCTNTEVIRPVGRLDQLSYHESLLDRIRTLRKEGKTHEEITAQLNKEQWHPPRGRGTFSEQMVNLLCTRINRIDHTAQARHRRFRPRLHTHEWTIPALAKKIGMPQITMYTWVQQRRVTAHKVPGLGTLGVWVIRADAAEVERLRARRAAGRTPWPGDPSRAPQL
jgi:hypothetical protein